MGQEPGKYYIVLCVGNYGLSFELLLQGALSYDIQFKVFILFILIKAANFVIIEEMFLRSIN